MSEATVGDVGDADVAVHMEGNMVVLSSSPHSPRFDLTKQEELVVVDGGLEELRRRFTATSHDGGAEMSKHAEKAPCEDSGGDVSGRGTSAGAATSARQKDLGASGASGASSTASTPTSSDDEKKKERKKEKRHTSRTNRTNDVLAESGESDADDGGGGAPTSTSPTPTPTPTTTPPPTATTATTTTTTTTTTATATEAEAAAATTTTAAAATTATATASAATPTTSTTPIASSPLARSGPPATISSSASAASSSSAPSAATVASQALSRSESSGVVNPAPGTPRQEYGADIPEPSAFAPTGAPRTKIRTDSRGKLMKRAFKKRSSSMSHLIPPSDAASYTLETTAGFESIQGKRWTMEDCFVMFDDLAEEGVLNECGKHRKHPDAAAATRKRHVAFYGVYDGHGGDEAANIAEDLLHHYLFESQAYADEKYGRALRHAYLACDRQVLERSLAKDFTAGSTAVTALIIDNMLYVANVGDAECLLARRSNTSSSSVEYEVVLLTERHRPDVAAEARRVNDNGGFVAENRVLGSLAVSRSLGDIPFRYPWNRAGGEFVIADPTIQCIELQPRDDFLIVACDGIFDCLTYQQVVSIAGTAKHQKRKDAYGCCETVVREAVSAGTLDNCSIVIVYFDWHAKDAAHGALSSSDGKSKKSMMAK